MASGGLDACESLSGRVVSVVICTYRREDTLRQLILDLLQQRDVDPEIVVVDQTPEHEPETNALLMEHRARLKHIQISEPNLPNARNVGLVAAFGEIIVFIDDDLRVPPDFLRGLLSHFDEPEVDGIAPLVAVNNEDPLGAYTERFYGFRSGWRDRRRISVQRVIGACMAFRRELVIELDGFEPLMGRLNPSAAMEDYEFCGRWIAAGHLLWLAPQVQALHHTDIAGGCDVRTVPRSESFLHQLRAMTFVVLKEQGSLERVRLRAVPRLLRIGVVRRDLLERGPAEWVRSFWRLRRVVKDVLAFWQAQNVAPRELSGRSAGDSTGAAS
jgi:GT2 family glycosyltransferase